MRTSRQIENTNRLLGIITNEAPAPLFAPPPPFLPKAVPCDLRREAMALLTTGEAASVPFQPPWRLLERSWRPPPPSLHKE